MRIRLSEKGPEVSRIALGMMRLRDLGLSPSGIVELVEESLEAGVTTFDFADIYGGYTCEETFGDALSLSPSLRGGMQIVTKFGIVLPSPGNPGGIKHYDTSREHISRSVESSLRKLRTGHIDLLLIHRPDPLMDIEEVGAAFEELRGSGKVLHFGVSNFTPAQYELLSERLPVPLVTNQVECSVLHLEPFEDGVIDSCVRHGIRPMAWSPLAGGELFTGKDDRSARVRGALERARAARGAKTIDMVALAWLLGHPAGIVPVLGTGRIERIRDAVEAARIELSREEWFGIWSASSGTGVP